MARTQFSRRTVVGAAAALAAGLAGCSGGSTSGTSEAGGSSDDADADGSGSAPAFEGYLSNASNYDGIVDETGNSEVAIAVGAEANGGNWGYGPAAVRVSTGTTVVWEWSGRGGPHDVVAEDGSFSSEQMNGSGHTYTQTFEESGVVKYYCTPHRTLGMKGVVVVDG
ncbi:halocyanin domain-containing protein [Halobellus sp. Atlit-38R]|jgi:halocyanin-like protein|uniref:halocyanin domain-containing protein n=1 Tax=Halobellus sp. Atlit-38R TaxID=2282131 RepID=UPI000EF1D965|nr:halocyanin domain-containing protein [Halobellus sp. Atlit-38R]RLM84059.1 halocyanin domain-containing protein [Halobellus sp. Atlit-38R]